MQAQKNTPSDGRIFVRQATSPFRLAASDYLAITLISPLMLAPSSTTSLP